MKKVSVELGGTGGGTASEARTNLELGTIATKLSEIEIKTADFSIVAADDGKLFKFQASSTNITATLPTVASAGDGFIVGVKRIDATSHTVTIEGNGAETIDGALNTTLTSQYHIKWFRCDGTEWWVDTEYNPATGSGDSRTLLFSNTISSTITNVDAGPADLDWTAYDLYEIEYSDIHVDNDDSGLRLRIYDTGAAAWQTSTFHHIGGWVVDRVSKRTVVDNSLTYISLEDNVGSGEAVGNDTLESARVFIRMIQPNNSSYLNKLSVRAHWNDSANRETTYVCAATTGIAIANAISGIRLYSSPTGINKAQVTVWGINT